jgi:hypothetical protein
MKSDKRIDKKIIKTMKNSCIMITGEFIFIDSVFHFLPTSNLNIELSTLTKNSSSYS